MSASAHIAGLQPKQTLSGRQGGRSLEDVGSPGVTGGFTLPLRSSG